MPDSKTNQPTSRKVRGKPFQKGNSGRPKGSRNRSTIAREALLEGQADEIIKKTVELALEGDRTALKLCFERILGGRRDRPVSLELPEIHSAKDAKEAMASLIAAVASGDITPAEAATVSDLISTTIRVIEINDLEQRVADLENDGVEAAQKFPQSDKD